MTTIERSAGDLLAHMGTDAERWAREFSATFRRLQAEGRTSEELLDGTAGEWLFGWFANAIAAGESSGYVQGKLSTRWRERARWRRIEMAHQLDRKLTTPLGLKVAKHAPTWVRRWMVVQLANEAIFAMIEDGRRPDGYAGPDGLTYVDFMDAAARKHTK